MILMGASAYLYDDCIDEEVLLCGPAGTSKTVAGCQLLIKACSKYPGSRHLLCRAERSAMTDTTLVTLESVIGDKHPEVTRVSREQRHSYRLFGSEIVCAGLDEPAKAFGSAWGKIIVEEAIQINLETWELFGRAARDPKFRRAGETAGKCPHQRIAITNPGNPSHWLNTRASREPASTQIVTKEDWKALYRYNAGPQTGKMRRLMSVHQDNPTLFDHDAWAWTLVGLKYLESLAMMSGFRRERMLAGKWVSGEGDAVFDADAMTWMDAAAAALEKRSPTVCPAGTIRIKEHREVMTQPGIRR